MREYLLALLTAGLIAVPSAWGSEAPSLTRIIVGYSPGGGADVVTRAYAESLRHTLKRNVIVENRPGAAGTLAGGLVSKAQADGSTLMFGNIVINVLSPYTFRSLPYDPAADFVAIGQMAKLDLALAVPIDPKVRTLSDYVAAAKADPKKATFGTPAAGSLPHFFGLLLGRAAGVELVHVAYKGGPVMNGDLMGGQLPGAISSASDFIQLHKAGKLRMLATSGDQRAPNTPDVPTFRELGFADLRGTSWFALFAPSGTPPDELARLAAAMQEATKDPNVRKVVESLGIDMPPGTLEDFKRQVAEERQRWAPIVKASGFTTEK